MMEFRPTDIRALSLMLRPPDAEAGDSSDDDLPPPGLSSLGPGSIGPKGKSGNKASSNDKGGNFNIKMGGFTEEDDEAEIVPTAAKGAGVAGSGDGVVSPGDKSNIWSPEEATEVPDDDNADPRPRPEYDMRYRQAVHTEDVYLQMGGRTPATASCEDLVVSVLLPGERYPDVSVSVLPRRLDVRSPCFRLPLALPHRVDPEQSRARWDPEKHELLLLLRLKREFDYVNF